MYNKLSKYPKREGKKTRKIDPEQYNERQSERTRKKRTIFLNYPGHCACLVSRTRAPRHKSPPTRASAASAAGTTVINHFSKDVEGSSASRAQKKCKKSVILSCLSLERARKRGRNNRAAVSLELVLMPRRRDPR